MISFLILFKSYSVKRLLWLFFAFVIGFSLFGFSFVSCAPGIDEQASGNSNGNDDGGDGDGTRRRRDDDDDEDDGDRCRGNETCERVCEHIYKDYSEQTECMDEGDLQVGRLQKVHDLLMEVGRDADDIESDLQELSDGEGEVDINHFEDYLKIGTKKWIEQIKVGLDNANSDTSDKKFARLIETVKWLVEDKEVAEILSEVNTGNDVLEKLLLALDANDADNGTCISKATPAANPVKSKDTDLWDLDGSNNIVIAKYNKTAVGSNSVDGRIELDNAADGKLYDALSCQYDNITSRNVFSYAAREDNATIFNMAFDLLVEICDDVETKDDGQDKACAKTLMCWTSWQDAGGEDGDHLSNSNNFWELAENKKSNLEEDSRYYDCTAESFAEFFE